jgi:hypothetical protein
MNSPTAMATVKVTARLRRYLADMFHPLVSIIICLSFGSWWF